MKKSLLPMLLAGMLIISCKKEKSEESTVKPETTIETTTEAETEAATEIQKPEDLGKTIFEGKGACVACHKPDVKGVGPSLQDIAKIYKDKNGDMLSFFQGAAKPIVDPTQYDQMKASLVVTKTFSDEELKALEAYVYSYLK